MLLTAILSGFIVAALAPLIYRIARQYSAWLLALLPLGLFAFFASHLNTIAHGQALHESLTWIPSLNINLSFMLDGLSMLMALIVSGIGAVIIVYAGGYLRGDPHLDRMYAFLLAFMASMLGLVLSDNLLTLFVFWELTSLTSYLLIGFKHDEEESRTAALRALIVTGAGGLAMLGGFVLLALAGGSWDISSLNGEAIRESALYLPALLLVAAGAFTKSAQFPFHFWLPGAMAAPTPVSAYLHSATMVKAGVYLLARLSPLLAGTDEWRLLLTLFGGLTMLLGGYLSLKQTDLKRILAYSTVSSLGVLVMLLGWNTTIAVEAAVLFLLVHSLYKGALFMVAGSIDHATSTRDIRLLGGLGRVMPLLMLAAGLAALSMSGIPLFLGFLGKELIYESTLGYEIGHALSLSSVQALLTLAAVLTNIAFVGVALLVTLVPFLGNEGETPQHPHAPPLDLWLSPLILGALGLILGLLPAALGEMLLSPAASAVYGQPLELHLSALPTTLTPMLLLSVVTVAGGIAIYAVRRRMQALYDRLNPSLSAERLYDDFIQALPRLADSLTRLTQSGYLRYYVATIVGVAIMLIAYTYFVFSGLTVPVDTIRRISDIQFHEAVIGLVIVVGLISVMRANSLLVMVVSLGVIGYGVAIVFILFGAPDLAMTQFAIETLSVILFVLVLYRLPGMARLSTMRARIRDGILALITGVTITTLVLTITDHPLSSDLKDFFAQASYTLAHGHNIVNVILVDFRGFDTMGEITVLGIAGIGIFALLKLRLNGGDKQPDDDQKESDEV